jgi:hypothetical protein
MSSVTQTSSFISDHHSFLVCNQFSDNFIDPTLTNSKKSMTMSNDNDELIKENEFKCTVYR